MIPEFPRFKPIELEDRAILQDRINRYQPETSEWTFTNLFIWRWHYRFQWSVYEDWLVVLSTAGPARTHFYHPIGPAPRLEVARECLRWLREERGEPDPRIERADRRLVEEIRSAADFHIESTRDHFDYLYRSEDLISLSGRRYHGKRNHLHRLRQLYSAEYSALEERHLKPCLELGGRWCELRRCEEDLNLLGEWEAIREALTHYFVLKIQGGVILIKGKVEAFSLGEQLNGETAVIHVEKANPEIPGLYSLMNQQFSERAWSHLPMINREQDLGEPGLRQAKLSYFPDHLVEKFRIRQAGNESRSPAGGFQIRNDSTEDR